MAQANAHPTSVARTAPVMTLAKFYARKQVIHDFQAAGIRYRGAAEINLAACAYLSGPSRMPLVGGLLSVSLRSLDDGTLMPRALKYWLRVDDFILLAGPARNRCRRNI